ncbi:MAG: hypothetical protein U0996_10385 [Planctomycetaceae bacterium]
MSQAAWRHGSIPGAPLNADNLNRGCLSKSPSVDSNNRSPRFDLNEAQIAAITAAIREASSAESDQLMALAKTLTTFRCTSCHVRDDYGGVHEDHNPFFAGSELEAGRRYRIPPPLTLVGAKLQPAWTAAFCSTARASALHVDSNAAEWNGQSSSSAGAVRTP